MFGLSFLTTLNIYKDCFKGHHNPYICPSSFFYSRSCCVCTLQGFVIKEFRDLHRGDELKNFVANIFLKLVSKPHTGICALNWLVMY